MYSKVSVHNRGTTCTWRIQRWSCAVRALCGTRRGNQWLSSLDSRLRNLE